MPSKWDKIFANFKPSFIIRECSLGTNIGVCMDTGRWKYMGKEFENRGLIERGAMHGCWFYKGVQNVKWHQINDSKSLEEAYNSYLAEKILLEEALTDG